MTIHIESLRVDAIIGLLDFEREREQRIEVDLEAEYSYNRHDHSFINYAELVEMIELRLKKKHFLLLEEALLDLKEQITITYPAIESLKLKISKPEIFNHCTVALSQSWKL